MLWLLWACAEEKVEETKTGEQLLEDYFSQICIFYTDQECGQALAQCGEPVTLYFDWAQCMNSQSQRTSLCGRLPSILEAEPQDMESCLSLLKEVQCTTEEMCGSEHVLFEGACGAVEELIIQECKPY